MFHLIPLMILALALAACSSELTAPPADGGNDAATLPEGAMRPDGATLDDATADLGTGQTLCRSNTECDDQIPCTEDMCAATSAGGRACRHIPRLAMCQPGETCDVAGGRCAPGYRCTTDDECRNHFRQECLANSVCDPVARVCVLERLSCDDGIVCTADSCVDSFRDTNGMFREGGCRHVQAPARCATGQTCDWRRGCVPGQICMSDADCRDSNQCTVREHCDPSVRICLYDLLDGDEDGEPPAVCGGNDCNDADRGIGPLARELCDGRDNNCNGQADESPRDCGRGMTCQGAGQPGATCRCTQPEVPGQFQRCLINGGVQQVCTDVRSDNAACGMNCRPCPMGSTCTAGRCVCGQVGQEYCEPSVSSDPPPACYDLRTDPQNCGECGVNCPRTSTGCQNGMCVCPAGETPCLIRRSLGSGIDSFVFCTNLQDDRGHCGMCNNPCLGGMTCREGACR